MTDRRLQDVSAAGQRARLLERLQAGPIDTVAARERMNILHPAARIMELRVRGHRILTHRQTIKDAQGFDHPSVAVYHLREGDMSGAP